MIGSLTNGAPVVRVEVGMGKQLLYRSVLVVLAVALPLTAQPVFTDVFPPEEFAARRARVMAKIGDSASRSFRALRSAPVEQPLRQANQFFYLTGRGGAARHPDHRRHAPNAPPFS